MGNIFILILFSLNNIGKLYRFRKFLMQQNSNKIVAHWNAYMYIVKR